jgi:small subunit ribosomal protein S16
MPSFRRWPVRAPAYRRRRRHAAVRLAKPGCGSIGRIGLACLLGRLPSPAIYRKINMVVIRLARGGAKKRPFYNIVVADARERRDGRYLERVGFYNPMAAGGEQGLRVALDRVSYWSGVGAQLSPTVKRLVGDAAKAQAAAPAAPAAA